MLFLFAPPGSAKSTYVSVLLPSWYLTNNPTDSILAAPHTVEFAERWGRRVRNDIAADRECARHQALRGQQGGSSMGAGDWRRVLRGRGRDRHFGLRRNLGVGDDLFGSREDAYSETVRQKRWDWYQDDFSARLKPGAKRIRSIPAGMRRT